MKQRQGSSYVSCKFLKGGVCLGDYFHYDQTNFIFLFYFPPTQALQAICHSYTR